MSTKRKWHSAPEASNPDPLDTTRPPKRKRSTFHEAPTSEEIHTARQLRQLLAFEQDLRRCRHGLQSFKELLDGILSAEAGDSEGNSKIQILVEYLEMTKPKEVGDEVPVYLPDVMEMWSMASQVNNENVMSAVAVVLALILKVLSSDVKLASIGLGIGRTVLQKRQLELISRNLSADKGRDFVISPSLRLVREIISLDGGALAIPAFRARNYTFRSLARNMGLRYLGEGVEDPKRPSVRTNAVRMLLSSLKYLHVDAKRDLLSQKDVVAALMRHLKEDPPFLIFEVLDSLRGSVVLDQKLPKDAKIRLLNAQSLIRIASLYSYKSQQAEEMQQSVEEAAHAFLLAACTAPSAGILRPQNGYYPEGVDADLILDLDSEEFGDLGLESITWMDKFVDEVPVRNGLLAEFIQTLRPWSSTKQNELLIAIFAACPELVANYFANKKSFNFDPKLTATWIGYSTLLFNTMLLEIPPFLGQKKEYANLPPPTTVVLGNILPLPLEVKAITRCFTQKSKLMSFFATRLLVTALEKLSKTLKMYKKASATTRAVWSVAARRLTDEFCQRIPNVKDIINAYRGMSDDDLLQRVAASRLLLLYHEVIPQAVLSANFDFSPMLSGAISRYEASDKIGEDAAMRLMELENLFTLAKYSPTMRWFSKRKEALISPFVTLMKLYAENAQGLARETIGKTLKFVAEEHNLMLIQSVPSGLKPLIDALSGQSGVDPEIWSFLDGCFERCARSPIKYGETALEICVEQGEIDVSEEATPSPLMMAVAEQLPFFVSPEKDKKVLISLARILSDYLGFSRKAGVNDPLLKTVLQRFVEGFGDNKTRKKLSISDVSPKMELDDEPVSTPEVTAHISEDQTAVNQEQLEELLAAPFETKASNSALMKWNSKTAEELVEEGYAASVVWLLSSEHPSIRKEALTAITKMAAKVKESAYEENEQVWLLLTELSETARDHISEAPMPSTLLSFVSRGLDVLKNPLHCMYPKLNTFLLGGPTWELRKIPLVKDVLQNGPTEDDAYYTELSWLLSYLLDSLRTPDDLRVFHDRGVFERVLSLSNNPYMGPNLRIQILRILYRVSSIKGGSDTLITRFGVASWLVAQRVAAAENRAVYQALVRRLWDTCDQARIETWSRGAIKRMAEATDV